MIVVQSGWRSRPEPGDTRSRKGRNAIGRDLEWRVARSARATREQRKRIGDVVNATRENAQMVEGLREGADTFEADGAEARLQADNPAECRRPQNGAEGLSAKRKLDRSARDRGG